MPRIFVSYKRADRPFLKKLLPLLQRAHGMNSIWYDEQIAGGQSWWEKILKEIEECDVFIYLLSNDSLKSPYCLAEFEEAIRLNKSIIPVVCRLQTEIPKQFPKSVADAKALKAVLRKIQWITLINHDGEIDATAIVNLNESIRELISVSNKTQSPQTPDPTPMPPVDDKRGFEAWLSKGWWIGAVGIVAIIVVIIQILSSRTLVENTPTLTGFVFVATRTPTETVVPATTQPNDTFTTTATIKPISTMTPTQLIVTQTPTETVTPTRDRPSDTFTPTVTIQPTSTMTPTYVPDQIVFICVVPDDGPEYLLEFRNAEKFGISISEVSSVMIFSNSVFGASEYLINPDAPTGGYHTQNEIIYVAGQQDDQIVFDECNRYEEINDLPFATHPIRVDSEYAIIFDKNMQYPIGIPSFLGVFAFYFPEFEPFPISFQIIQLTKNSIEFRPPNHPNNTSYLVIGNKTASISEGFENLFSGRMVFQERSILMEILSQNQLDLFGIMRDKEIRIYPASGLINTNYVPGYFIRIQDFNPSPPSRSFNLGQRIKALEGTRAYYYLADRPLEPYGYLDRNDGATVHGIDETGYLIITDGRTDEEFIIESWLVEGVPE